MIYKFYRAVCRQITFYVGAKVLSDFKRILSANQSEADFSRGFGRQYRFESLTSIAAFDAMDLTGRATP